MELQVAATSLRCLSQPSGSHSPSSSSSSSKAFASAIYSPTSRKRSFFGDEGSLRYAYTSLLLYGCKFSKLHRSRSCEKSESRLRTVRKTLSASLDRFSHEEFGKFDDEGVSKSENGEAPSFRYHMKAFDPLETPEFFERDEIFPASCVDSPFSAGIVRRRSLWQDGIMQAGETAYCSVKKAFSSMVFIIRELHSFTMQMREILFYEDLQGILGNVQKEIHASFVWLFQKVFSHTPTLMVYVMILLANYSVYSMSTNTAIAATSPVQAYTVTMEQVSTVEDQNVKHNADSSIIKNFMSPSSNGKMSSVGGNGGGKFRPVASSTDGDDRFDKSNDHHHSDENSLLRITGEAEDYYPEYSRTELQYQMVISEEPSNPLLLANYAQFLYLVAKDFERAEEYFKRATKIEPKDADALNKYAKFLWLARKDIFAAEETYLESIAAENRNSFYAADYAHFLWNTGGKDTCFPLNSPESDPSSTF